MDYSKYYDDDYVNYDYWLLLDSWSKYQASCLLCGEEPDDKYGHNDRTREMEEIITSGYRAKTLTPISQARSAKLRDIEIFFRPQDIIKWAIKKGLDIPKELVDWYEQYKKQKNAKQVIEQLDIERENYRLIAIENESLKKQITELNELQKTTPFSKQLVDDLHPKERNTLLKTIAVIASKGYGNNLSQPHVLAHTITHNSYKTSIIQAF